MLEIAPDSDEQKSSGGPIQIKNLSPPRFLVIADALAKTVALARDEREVNAVFDVIEPFAAKLAATGRPPFRRRAMLRLIGQALLAQHRVSGRVAVEEKPDVLWDHPELERLYARLADEYELTERADVSKRKLEVIGDTAQALTDIIDADRATRLEAAIVILIVLELIAAIVQIALALHGRWRASARSNIFVLTGAGISAESGLGTFRDKKGEGIWAKFDPMKLATPEAFARDPEAVLAFYDLRRRNLLDAKPNAAHFALARLEGALAERGGSSRSSRRTSTICTSARAPRASSTCMASF